MPDIKLRDGSGVENTYVGVDTITLPLADGSGNWTFGLTDEDLTVSGENMQYLFFDNAMFFKQAIKYMSRIKVIPFVNEGKKYIICSNVIALGNSYNNPVDFSDLVIDCDGVTYFGLGITEGYFINFPTLINANNMKLCNFVCGNSIYTLTSQHIMEYLSHFKSYAMKSAKNSNTSTISFIPFTKAYRITDTSDYFAKFHEILNDEDSEYYSSPSYGTPYMYSGTYLNFKNIPLLKTERKTINQTSNLFAYIPYDTTFSRCKSITFMTENGQPIIQNMRSQTLDFSKTSSTYLGYYNSYATSSQANFSMNPDWDNAPNIFTSDDMTIEQATERYNQIKSNPYWYSQCSNSVSYGGKTINLARLFSKYNHDSAVETINSLPDTSAYLATAGGTNTIKFDKYMGALTDGGGCGDLTPAEIQVATDKGWTVTIVN